MGKRFMLRTCENTRNYLKMPNLNNIQSSNIKQKSQWKGKNKKFLKRNYSVRLGGIGSRHSLCP